MNVIILWFVNMLPRFTLKVRGPLRPMNQAAVYNKPTHFQSAEDLEDFVEVILS